MCWCAQNSLGLKDVGQGKETRRRVKLGRLTILFVDSVGVLGSQEKVILSSQGRVKVCVKKVFCGVCSQKGWYGLARSSELTPDLFVFERSDSLRFAQNTTSSPSTCESFPTCGSRSVDQLFRGQICWQDSYFFHSTMNLNFNLLSI